MIKSIHIQNFKVFKSLNVKDLPRILLIGGKKNSGKTSLLEAIFFPLDFANPDMFTRLLRWRGVDSIDIDSVFSSAYHNFKVHQPMVFEYTVNSSKQKLQYDFLPPSIQPLNIHKGSVIELQNSPVKNMGGIKISLNSKKSSSDVFLKRELDGFSLNILKPEDYITTKAVFMNSTMLRGDVETNAKRYGALDKINRTKEILSSLQILEPKIKSLSVIPAGNNKPALYGDIGMEEKVHLNLMGQGIIRLLSILLGISSVENGVILIDELENGFHHSVLSRVWEVITTHAKRCNTQIIATTHSWELISSAIEGVPQELRSDFQYRRIERKENFIFKTVDYDFSTLETAVSSNLETR